MSDWYYVEIVILSEIKSGNTDSDHVYDVINPVPSQSVAEAGVQVHINEAYASTLHQQVSGGSSIRYVDNAAYVTLGHEVKN